MSAIKKANEVKAKRVILLIDEFTPPKKMVKGKHKVERIKPARQIAYEAKANKYLTQT